MLDGIVAWLSSIAQSIADIPRLIIDDIKSIFIPDFEVVQGHIDKITNSFQSSMGVEVVDFDVLFNSSTSHLTDVTGTIDIYGVGSFTQNFTNFYFVEEAVAYFKPYIRGFFVFLLLFYNLNQFLSFIKAGRVMEGDGNDS